LTGKAFWKYKEYWRDMEMEMTDIEANPFFAEAIYPEEERFKIGHFIIQLESTTVSHGPKPVMRLTGQCIRMR
jgi:hypothetical protein